MSIVQFCLSESKDNSDSTNYQFENVLNMNFREVDQNLKKNPKYLEIKASNKPIGLITGVFDLLHQGHLIFLENARDKMKYLGGYLLIGVESDLRVKTLKGKDRPIDDQNIRIKKLTKTNLAEVVFLLPEDFSDQKVRMDLLLMIRPHFLLVSESTPNIEKKKSMMAKIGGTVEVVCQHNPKYSTSQIIMKTR